MVHKHVLCTAIIPYRDNVHRTHLLVKGRKGGWKEGVGLPRRSIIFNFEMALKGGSKGSCSPGLGMGKAPGTVCTMIPLGPFL